MNKKQIIAITITFIVIIPLIAAWTACADTLETKHTIIKGTKADIKTFRKAVQGYWLIPPKETLSDAVDRILEHVQETLGMKKKFKDKIIIELYADKHELYAEFIKKKNTAFRNYKSEKKLRAWYIHKENTIYFNVQDVHGGMLAHEMGHVVADHYLLIMPPSKTAEILARAAEMGL